MISQVSGFTITEYFNTKAPPEVAGSIVGLSYWYEGLVGWASLTETPPTVPLNTAFHLVVGWLNQSAEPISGHVELTIAKPDGTKVTLSDVLNQDNWAAPGNGWGVQFEPITLDQAGTYQATAILSTIGQVLDEKISDIATVPAVAEFYMPPTMDIWIDHVEIVGWYYHRITYACLITNRGGASGTHVINWQNFYDTTQFGGNPSKVITLGPGQSYLWSNRVDIDFHRCHTGTCKLYGDWPENNFSQAYLVEGDVVIGNLIEEKHSEW